MKSTIKICRLALLVVYLLGMSQITHAQWTRTAPNVYLTTSTDKVGIGTTSPAQKLDVNGNLNIAGGSGFYINNERVIHAFESNFFAGQRAGDLNTDGKFNTGVGADVLLHNTSGYANTAGGYTAMFSNINGSYNTAYGIRALYYNTRGTNNIAVGSYALYKNIEGWANTASGSAALVSNISGNTNTATGYGALFNNINGSLNTGYGVYSLFANTRGNFNTAAGVSALVFNNTGDGNTAQGYGALFNNIDGNYNTSIGYFAGFEASHLSNSTAIGANSAITADNQVRLGDNTVTSIGGYVDWTNISDGRVKKNIKENVPGLAFINKLKAVTYNLDLDAAGKITESAKGNDKYSKPLPPLPLVDGMNIEDVKISPKDNKMPIPAPEELAAIKEKEHIVYTGFVAQDVEKAAKELNYDFSGVDAAKNDKDLYGLRYAQFVVPLVKAVQELSSQNDSLKEEINQLKSAVYASSNMNNGTATITVNSLSDAPILGQNIPNPAANNTIIPFRIPKNCNSASIVISEIASGKIVTAIPVSCSETHLAIDAGTLASGSYTYSLYINGKLVDSKQMIMAR